jgi:VWFA-related protein
VGEEVREMRTAAFLEGESAVNAGPRAIFLATTFGVGLVFTLSTLAQQQPSVPDAPTPQAPTSLPGGPITPGIGSAGAASSSSTAAPSQAQAPSEPPPPPSEPPMVQQQPDEQATPPEQGAAARANFVMQVNFVEVPVTVKDTKGNPVAGLTWRDFTVYENNTKEALRLFSVDPAPLSVAFVIDQTLPANYMDEVNRSLGAIQGAMTPYDEAAVFTYTHFTKEWTGFTGGQSSRLPAVLSLAQATGTPPGVADPGADPLSMACSISVNGNCPDPNLQPGHQHQIDGEMNLPKEIHTLNDAILAAAKELSTRPKERRRIIFVISDGKEYGSKATWKEVVHYLQTNNIAVDATIVGDTAHWGEGWLDRFHVPFTGVYDNILYKYTTLTGGEMFAEGSVNKMEKSYQKIADEARNQYTLGYLSHESIYDDKYRSIDVRVDRPNIVVTAKPGYYPSAQEYK